MLAANLEGDIVARFEQLGHRCQRRDEPRSTGPHLFEGSGGQVGAVLDRMDPGAHGGKSSRLAVGVGGDGQSCPSGLLDDRAKLLLGVELATRIG